jgi:Skp family chaperone for outer membrane proteins
MKTLLVLALATVLSIPLSAAELKIVTVDLQRLLTEYERAKEAGKQLKEKQISFQKELQGLQLEVRQLAGEVEELQKLSFDNALSGAERETKKKAFESKLVDLRAFEVRYDTVRAQREADFQAFASQTNKRVMDEVLSATRSVGERTGVNLILNTSRANPAASDVLYAKGVEDITEQVLVSLNAARR